MLAVVSGTDASMRWICWLADVEPRAAEAEVGSVGALDRAEHVDVEPPRLLDVLDVDGHVVKSERSHHPRFSRR